VRIRSKACSRLLAALVSVFLSSSASALEVFACEPEWAALVKVLAPEARVTTATHAHQDPHYIEARPALIGALRRADLAVCTGASLEVGWLPMLQQRAANAKVRNGGPGMFYAAEAVDLIDKRDYVDRSMGDVHAEGNPHFHLDPHRFKTVAKALALRLGNIDPASAQAYGERYDSWASDWEQRIAEWNARAAPLRGREVVAQHTAFAYLWSWLSISQVGDLEPKPGVPPTMSHLQELLQGVRSKPPMAIVRALHHEPQAAQWLAEQTGRPLLVLPATVTPDGPTADPAGLFDALIEQLLGAAERTPRP
jgi:zinc/manganese transport system substrate-binding protein